MSQENNFQNFNQALKFVIEKSITALKQADGIYNQDSLDSAMNTMRRVAEAVAKSIIFHKTQNDGQAYRMINFDEKGKEKFKAFAMLIKEIKEKSWINEAEKQGLEYFKESGNAASHANNKTLSQAEVEKAKVNFRDLIRWFFNFVQTNPSPELEQALQGQHLSKEEKERKNKLHNYFKKNAALFKNKVFQEGRLRLKDLYINPYVNLWKECLTNNKEYDYIFERNENIKSLGDFAQAFKHNNLSQFNCFHNPESRLLLLLGYPGQGKTSFCQYFSHQDAEEINAQEKTLSEAKVFYLRLRDVHAKNLFTRPMAIIQKHLSEEIFDTADELKSQDLASSVLILDGLDEVAMRENNTKDSVSDFCLKLERELAKSRWQNLRIILTSRYGYVNLERLKKRDLIVAEIGRLDFKQQKTWLKTYSQDQPDCSIQEASLEKIHNDKGLTHIKELIDQPILLYLIASAKLSLEEISDRNQIYQKLFDKLVKRTWENNQQIENLRGLEAQDLRNYLGLIAFEIFKSPYEYLRKTDLEKLPESKTFLGKLENSQITSILKTLMIAFYMQEVQRKPEEEREEGDKDNYAIEFLHKSLQEYLAAEYLWGQIQYLSDQNTRTKTYQINRLQEAQDLLQPLLSSQQLSKEMTGYLQSFADKEENLDPIFERLKYFFHLWLEKLEETFDSLTHKTFAGYKILCANWIRLLSISNKDLKNFMPKMEEKSVVVKLLKEHDLPLNLFNGCEIAYLNFIDKQKYFYAKHKSVIKQKITKCKIFNNSTSLNNTRLKECLLVSCYIKLSKNSKYFKCKFIKTVLGRHLEDNIFKKCKFIRNNICNLKHQIFFTNEELNEKLNENKFKLCLFRSSNIYFSLFTESVFNKINIKYSIILFNQELFGQNEISEITLYNVSLNPQVGANNPPAKLNNIKLTNCSYTFENYKLNFSAYWAGNHSPRLDLSYSSLEKQNLDILNFSNFILVQTNFREASLQFSNLSKIQGQDADFSLAKLRGSHFYRAQLEKACFYKAELVRANLREANLQKAILVKANLRKADLRGADLRGANLAGADLRGARLEGAKLYGVRFKENRKSFVYIKHGAMWDKETETIVELDGISRIANKYYQPNDEQLFEDIEKELKIQNQLSPPQKPSKFPIKEHIEPLHARFNQHTIYSPEELKLAKDLPDILHEDQEEPSNDYY